MTAYMSGKITERNEKGIGPVSFKRLLLAAGAFALTNFILAKHIGFLGGSIISLIVMIVIIAVTQPVMGYPLLLWVFHTVRGLITVSIAKEPDSKLSAIATTLKIEEEHAFIDADEAFNVTGWETHHDTTDGLNGFSYVGSFQDASNPDRKALRAIKNPFSRN